MLVLFIAGPTDTMGFAFAIILGILVGTYSSILIATPIVVDLSKEEAQKNQVATPKKKGRSKVGNR